MQPTPHVRAGVRTRLAASLMLVLLALVGLLAVVPTVASAEATPITTYADEGCNHANVVLLIRFAGDTVGDNGDGYNTPAPDYRHPWNVYTSWDTSSVR